MEQVLEGHAVESGASIGLWIDQVAAHLARVAPERKALVDDYVGEARFGAAIIADDLSRLADGARVLEIGAGALILSCALQAAGYRVTAIEPLGVGFSHLDGLRDLVLGYAGREARGGVPELLRVRAEVLDRPGEFNFAFSINVMEHVDDIESVLRQAWAALTPGAGYRFVCPNYSFPFEPHFGIPTCGGKALTWALFRKRILASDVVTDPAGTWESLNWISVRRVRRICRAEFGVAPEFDRSLLARYLRRAMNDPSFQRRHGALVQVVALLLGNVGTATLAELVPPVAQPAMSCWLAKPQGR